MEKWKRPSEELHEMLESLVLSYPCDRRKMFGSVVYFVNNNMFAGVHQDSIFMRLSPGERDEELASERGATPFEPLEGRVMKEYLSIPAGTARDVQYIKRLLDRSYAFVASMRPKEKKRKK